MRRDLILLSKKSRRVALLCRWIVDGNRLYAAVLKTERGQARIEAIMITLPEGVVSVLGEADLGFLNGGIISTVLDCHSAAAVMLQAESRGLAPLLLRGSAHLRSLE